MKRLGLAGLILCVVVLVSMVFAHPTLDFVTVFSDTDGGGMTDHFSGWVITNTAATGSQTFKLPPAASGLHFIFALSAAQKIVVNPQNDDLFIAIAPTLAAGEAIESDQVVGTLIEIVAVDATKWLAIRKIGTWTDVT